MLSRELYGRFSPHYNRQYSITLAREQMTIENISSRLAMVDSWRDVFSVVLLLSVVTSGETNSGFTRRPVGLSAPLPACVGGTKWLAVQSTGVHSVSQSVCQSLGSKHCFVPWLLPSCSPAAQFPSIGEKQKILPSNTNTVQPVDSALS